MKLIIITGQTATGKTKLALEYAKNPPEGGEGELINCDSRQIYKYLDIITGKDLKKNSKLKTQNSKPQLIISKRINNFDIGFYPISSDSNQFQLISTDFNRFQPIIINQCQQFSTKIWLYDIVDPKQPFSSFDWKKCAQIVIDDIIKRGKIPIIVGGTYLYLKHLLYGVETENIKPNWQLREKLAKKSVEQLQEILKNLSPRLFNQLNQSDKNNPHRLIRKIEIANYLNSTNQSYQSNLSNFSNFKPVSWKVIGLKFKNKENLVKTIKNRVEERLKNGAIEEAESLLKKGYCQADPGLKTIGYQQLIAYLQGKLTKEEAVNKWITEEIQYAKRQYTFMKKDPNIKWVQV